MSDKYTIKFKIVGSPKSEGRRRTGPEASSVKPNPVKWEPKAEVLNTDPKGHSRQLKVYFNHENSYNFLVYNHISFPSLKKGGETFVPKNPTTNDNIL